jgi:hypothetical protein
VHITDANNSRWEVPDVIVSSQKGRFYERFTKKKRNNRKRKEKENEKEKEKKAKEKEKEVLLYT